MLIKIKCLKCGIEGSMSLVQPSYRGPYRCWKCRELFTIELENNKLKSCVPLSQEDFDRQQATEALKAKLKKQ